MGHSSLSSTHGLAVVVLVAVLATGVVVFTVGFAHSPHEIGQLSIMYSGFNSH